VFSQRISDKDTCKGIWLFRPIIQFYQTNNNNKRYFTRASFYSTVFPEFSALLISALASLTFSVQF